MRGNRITEKRLENKMVKEEEGLKEIKGVDNNFEGVESFWQKREKNSVMRELQIVTKIITIDSD